VGYVIFTLIVTAAASRVFRIRGGLQDGPNIRSVPMLALDKCACYGTGLGVGFPGRIIMTELGEEHIQFLEM